MFDVFVIIYIYEGGNDGNKINECLFMMLDGWRQNIILKRKSEVS